MSVWFESNPQLLTNEIESLEKYGISHEVKYEGPGNFKLIIECIIPNEFFENNSGQDLSLKIIYPDNFPFFRPDVQAVQLHLPRHQNPIGKNLCLLGRASDYWNVQTIGEFLKERLPLIFEQGPITDPEVIKGIPNEQAEPISEYFITDERVFLTTGRPEILNQETPEPTEKLTILKSGKLGLGLEKDFHKINILTAEGPALKIHVKEWMSSTEEKISHDFKGKIPLTKDKSSSWYMLSRFPGKDFFNNFEKQFQQLIDGSTAVPLKSLNLKTKNYNHIESCCLIFPEEQEAGLFKWGWVFIIFSTTSNTIKRKIPFFRGKFSIISKVLSLSPTDLSLRIPQSKGFHGKTIGVIGTGAIGAPAILEFAKNGCEKLKILDQDSVELSNTVRWPLGNEYVGWNKVFALKDYIEKNYSSVKVEAFHHRIGYPYTHESENNILNNFMNDCDLLLDASVEQGINHLISIRSWNWNIPYLLIEGRRGGWGGLVAKIIPENKTGCWMCMQNKLYSDEETEKIPIPLEDEKGIVQQRGCGDVTFTGANFDMMNIPLAAVKLAANILSEDDNFEWDVAILSNVKDDDDHSPTLPQWTLHTLGVSPNCCYKDDLHA